MKGLRELVITFANTVNDEGLGVISSSFHFLTKLGLSSSKAVTI